MKLNIEITNETTPLELSRLAQAITVLSGKSIITETCGNISRTTIGVTVANDSQPRAISGTVAFATDDTVCGDPAATVGETSGELDTAAIFGNSPLSGKLESAPEIDTAAIGFGGSAPAPSTADAAPLATAQTQQAVAGQQVNANPASAANDAPAVPPVPTAASSANPVAGVEVDKRGLPWDGRIHGREKTKNKDGTWRGKRGVDKDLVTEVEAELRTAMAANAQYIPKPGEEVTASTPTPPPVPTADSNITSPGKGAFPQLMGEITPLIHTETNPNGIITQDHLRECAAGLGLVDAKGVGQVTMLIHRPDMIPAFRATINTFLGTYGISIGA